MRATRTILCVLLGVLVGANWAELAIAAPQRIALVIGNAAYPAENRLANPVRDATTVTVALRRAGYTVFPLNDATKAQMDGAITAFRERVSALEPGSVALFYYAGHGFSISDDNYLVPRDAQISNEGGNETLVPMALVLDAISAHEGVAGLAFFDACRVLPANQMWRDYGFVRRERPNTFVAYSTGAGATATDGGAGLGGPFAGAFAEALAIPGLSPGDLMSYVAVAVSRETGGQSPVSYNGLTEGTSVTAPPTTDAERSVHLAYLAALLGYGRQSLDLALPQANSGNSQAIRLAAALYNNGFPGFQPDEASALRWYRRGWEHGDAEQHLSWAAIAASSATASQRDRDDAIAFVQQEAARGVPEALYILGFANLGRPGVRFTRFQPSNIAAAIAYRQAADAGHIGAAINFGYMAYAGSGLPAPDPAEAARRFEQAARAGSPRGMTAFGEVLGTYRERRRDARRDAEALYWYRLAARSSYPEALLRLSVAYALGIGVVADRSQALSYIDQAERAATPGFRNRIEAVGRDIDAFDRALRSGRTLVEPACPQPGRGCALVTGFDPSIDH